MYTFKDATKEDVDSVMQKAWSAFESYRSFSIKQRAAFMHAIANELTSHASALIPIAMAETHLSESRLQSELTRTVFQLNSYADACEQGNWLDVRIDKVISDRQRPGPDLRKMLIPLGPVIVFGSSNFPFAYSTAGGDTACALAAGCPVIVKAHPAHAQTSEEAASCILKAAKICRMPEGIFTHVHGVSFEVGKELVLHPLTKAVGFTGSLSGGKALFDLATQRKDPIPVFAEMGSINPVYLLPEKLSESALDQAKTYAASINLSVGQFCTNPGLIIGIDGPDLQTFIKNLGEEIKKVSPSPMLHAGIAKSFIANRSKALAQNDVHTVAVSDTRPGENESYPTIASATAQAFMNNPVLHQEVFGPYSLVIKCRDVAEMKSVAEKMEGQLTSTLIATENDIQQNLSLVDKIKDRCGRIILNGVPTGVEVCLSMQHGGPYPATTDSRFTSVGADGIKRFARPVCYQNWPDNLLPDELKDGNPLKIWRTVNNQLTRD